MTGENTGDRKHCRLSLCSFQPVQWICKVVVHGRLFEFAQWRAAQLPDVGVTVNLDLGEYNDLHPLNKKESGLPGYILQQDL